jgi:hypothetical protein
MTISELSPVAVLALTLACWGAFRTEQLRRQGLNNALQQQVDGLRSEVTVLQLRLNPLFSQMDVRLAAMFHQPHPSAARLDRLIECYQTDATDPLRHRLSDRDLQELIDGIYQWSVHTDKDGPSANPEEHFRANFFLAQLDGLRDVRAYLRMQAERDQAILQAQELSISWWKRWCQWCVAFYRSLFL